MPAILFALISYFSWAFGDIFGTVATRKLGAYSSTFWSSILSVIIFALYAPFAPGNLSNLTPDLLVLNILLGILLWVSVITFSIALIIENPSLVATISGSFIAVTVILSIIFLNQTLIVPQILSTLVIFTGLILSSLNIRDLRNRKKIMTRGVILSLITMFIWGIYFTFITIPVRELSWFWPNVIAISLFPVLTFLYMIIRRIKFYPPTFKNALPFTFFGVFLVRIAEFNYNFAISKGLTAVVAPIAGSYPTLYVVLAFLIFKDKITKQQVLGITTTLVGIVLLSFFSI